MLTVGGLFSGIGGWELGLERAGMRVLWHCEADDYARRVLEQHWPGVPCYPDVREMRGTDVEPVDVLAGGFPCQDISVANTDGQGIDGARSGLWSEYARLIGELRPRYVCVENVAALLGRGLGRVLGDLAALGYDAEWDCIPARAVGAPHQRDRLWLVAYPQGERQPRGRQVLEEGRARGERSLVGAGARADGRNQPGDRASRGGEPRGDRVAGGTGDVADANGAARRSAGSAGQAVLEPGTLERPGRCGSSVDRGPRPVPDAYGIPPLGPPVAWRERGPWRAEPPVGRVADGVPGRMDRLRCLGNALVPQIAEWIGRRILEYEGSVT